MIEQRSHGGEPRFREEIVTQFEDIVYEVDGAAGIITINRPERYNAFRSKTVDELINAFQAAW